MGEWGVSQMDESGFEVAALERANAAVERLKEDYARDWAPAAIAGMYEALAAARRERAGRGEHFAQLYRLAHDMKGQGGTFGFPILTELGAALCRLTAGRETASDGEFALLRAHIDAARTVVAERVEGEGGAAGSRILAELRALTGAQLH